jgi:lipopolysaccharide/colanic/teichoic acid biosynthesis glycosyltransferase
MGVVKRVFDLVVSLAVLFLAAPLMVVIALAVRVETRGPILFKQYRLGKDKQEFMILKFRTMHHREQKEINQYDERVVSTSFDSRITSVGRLLRKTSLDELPQVINVLKGDMSIVGPRPIIPEQQDVVFPKYDKRFDVKPGMTGLAVVRGRRSLDWKEQLECDLEYVNTQSLGRDLGIMFKTVWVVLTGSGIYGDATKNWRNYRDHSR